MPNRKRIVRSLFVLWIVFSAPAAAAGALGEPEPIGEPGGGELRFRTDREGLFVRAPLQATEVRISIRGMLAEAVVTQIFSNPTQEWMEGVYVFPLPSEAAVHSLRMVIGERIIEGRVKEKAAAKKAYENAKSQGKKASLVEQERPNIFTTSVANIGPGETVEIEISYQQELIFDGPELELRFPMVVGPRYIPGSPVARGAKGTGWAFDTTAVPDASRITPPVLPPATGPVNPVALSVTLDAGFPLAHLSSPSHAVRITSPEEGLRHVVLDGRVFADRDFVLRWAPERGSAPRAAVFTEELNGEYFVLAMVMPPAPGAAEGGRLPRETIFVLDTSGSMGGSSITQAKAALEFALDQLDPADFFNVIEFNSSFRTLFADSRPAMPAAVSEAKEWVRRLSANGGTEMMGALMRALQDDVEHTPLRQIVFITDGCVGNEDGLFAAIENHLGRSRLFTVGIGSAPNGHFMKRAASFGRGTFTFIGSPAEVEPEMRSLFEAIETPVLADLDLVWPDPQAETWPTRLPDLYANAPIVVAARLGTIAGDLGASGIRAQEEWRVRVPLEVGTAKAGIDRLWARRKIRALMDRKIRGADETVIRQEVVDVALKHRLVSAYTSLVAVDVTPTRPADADLQTAAVPSNLPAGWNYGKVFGALPKGATGARLHLLLAALLIVVWISMRVLAGGRS